jgi:hypothetical protein
VAGDFIHPRRIVVADENELTPDEVKDILKKNGIESIDQLANLISASQAGKPFLPDISPVASSWIIKVWKLDVAAADVMPDHMGGQILKQKLGAGGPAGGVGGG